MRNKKLIITFSVLVSVTLLVILTSVLFSVQHVRVYCANAQESEFADEVLNSHGIKKNSSIFFVNESEVKANIEKKLGNKVRVLNIERVFPNKIYINYIEVIPYLRLRLATSQGITTYYCSDDLKVMYEYEGMHSEISAIDFKFKGEFSVGDGGALKFTDGSAATVVKEIFAGFEELGYYGSVIALFREIDLSGNYILLKVRDKDVTWQIHGADKLREKIRLALSYYDKHSSEIADGSVLIVPNEKTASVRSPG